MHREGFRRPLYHYRVEMSKAHDDVQWDGRGQVIPVQSQVPQFGHAVWIVHILMQRKGTDLCSVDT